LALAWSDTDPRRSELSQEALEQARILGDDEGLAYALLARHGVLSGPVNLPSRLGIAEEMRALSSRCRDLTVGFMSRILRIAGLLELGDIDAVDVEVETYGRESTAVRLPHFSWYSRLFRAMRARMCGRFEQAKELADEFSAIGNRVDDKNAAQSLGVHRMLQLWEDHRAEEGAQLIEGYIGQFPAVRGWQGALALLSFDGGNSNLARQTLERLARRDFAGVPRNEMWTSTMACLATLSSWLGDTERAGLLYELLLPGADQFAVIGFGVAFFGSISQYLGMCAATMDRWDESDLHFDRAVANCRRIGALPWVAHTHYEHARSLRGRKGRRHHDRARSEASEALQIASKIGMENIRIKAEALLA
jgi:tetratricopeptide (TPR) repeat protein